jgi:DNA-binding IclR family transcriptional regulator
LVLDTVVQASGGLTLAEVGQRTGLPQATVYRLVHALVHVGFLVPGERRKHYVIGPRLLRLISAGIPVRAVDKLAQPFLERLAADFGETAFIAKLEGEAVEMISVALPVGVTQAFVHPGRNMPFNAAASAKAILAFADDQLVSNVLDKPQQRFTARTKTSKEEISAELAMIRRQGYATCDQELDPGVLSYACPVRIGGSGVVYSLGVAGLRDRLASSPCDKVISSLKSAAASLSGSIRGEELLGSDGASAWDGPVPHRALSGGASPTYGGRP